MSNAKWCDQGNHPYSELDTEARSVTITMNRPDEYGRMRPASITKDICGRCGNSIPVLTSSESVGGAELEASQAEAAMWKAKYEATALNARRETLSERRSRDQVNDAKLHDHERYHQDQGNAVQG